MTTQFTIEKNIPLPPSSYGVAGSPWHDLYEKMQENDSVVLSAQDAAKFRTSVEVKMKKAGSATHRIAVRTIRGTEPKQARVWKIKRLG